MQHLYKWGQWPDVKTIFQRVKPIITNIFKPNLAVGTTGYIGYFETKLNEV
jgi:hypothetical protein